MSLDPPTYILSLQNNIRQRPISWEGAVRAKTITDADLKKIKTIDKVRKEQRKQAIEDDTDNYVTLFLGSDGSPSILQAAAKRADILQYMLVLIGDIVDSRTIDERNRVLFLHFVDNPSFVSALVKHETPYQPFLPLLKTSTNPEDPIPLLTSAVLSNLIAQALTISSKSSPQIDEALPQLFSYLAGLAKSSDAGLQDIAVQEYSAVLRTTKSRLIFWEQRKETLDPLMDILRVAAGAAKDNGSTLWSGVAGLRSAPEGLSGGVGIQLLYHVLLVIWQLSFEGSMVGDGLQE